MNSLWETAILPSDCTVLTIINKKYWDILWECGYRLSDVNECNHSLHSLHEELHELRHLLMLLVRLESFVAFFQLRSCGMWSQEKRDEWQRGICIPMATGIGWKTEWGKEKRVENESDGICFLRWKAIALWDCLTYLSFRGRKEFPLDRPKIWQRSEK